MAETTRPVIITAEELEMAYGDQIILDKATVTIHEGERMALVGRNGCGKSTFLKILTNEEPADSGSITRRKGLRSGYLSQEFSLDTTLNVYENILQGVGHITELLKEYETLPHSSPRFNQLEESINRVDGWNLDHKIDAVISALRCPAQDTPIRNLSGGEKRRVALAKVLISRPDFIILDEPTNHLDTMSIEWLEDMMQSYNGTCLFVTHDRYFLDRISTRIIELSRGRFQSFKGNYSDYLTTKAEQIAREEIAEGKRQKFLKKELEWVRRGPKARTTKAQFRVNRYHDIAAQEPPEKEMDMDLIIPPATRLGNRVVDLTKVTMGYGDKVLFKEFSLEFEPGGKIGIIGPNGVGKTTLIKLITGQLQSTSGTVEISQNTQFNIIDQERLALNNDNTIVEEIGEGYDFIMLGEERISIWGYLKRFLFTDERIRTQVGRLSGGERARLLLAKILKRGGNFIVLDEPTNDLDLSTLSLLEDALVRFKGCVLLVSHDRYFLNRVCNGIIAFEKNGELTYHVGNYDYYMSKRVDVFVGKKEKKAAKSKPRILKKSTIRKLKWKEERELESMEDAIMHIEEEIDQLQALFMTPDFFKQAHEKVKETQEKLTAAELERDTLYARWEELEAIKKGEVLLDN